MSPSRPALPALALVPVAALLAGAGAETVERRVAAMGTSLALEVTHATRAEALRASEEAVRALEAVEARLSTWRDESELSRLNAAPPDEPVRISPELAMDLERARELWRATDGAFDPGVGRLVELWGLRVGGRRPGPEELERALAAGGLASLALDLHASGGPTAVREHPELVLEEGAFGKGVGLDAAVHALHAAGARSARLDLGGQVALVPSDPREPVACAVAHPRDRARAVVEVELESGSLATTGNSERGIVVDGERRSHVLDPRTGAPAPDFGSVTVWAPDATSADALSTALYVMGPEGALAWTRARPGIEVLVLEARGDGLVARASAGLAGRVRPLARGLTIDFDEPRAADPTDTAGDAPGRGSR